MLWLALAALGLLVPAGCSRATACPSGKTCLRYMAWGNPEQLDVERKIIAKFNRDNPDLHIKLFTVPASSYGQKMTTMLVSGTAPDILRVDHYNFAAMQKKGYFVDLTPYAARDPSYSASDFVPTAIEEGTVEGRLYGLNVLFGGILIYYNRTLFEEAGLEDPYRLYLRGEWTWDQFRKSAIALTRFDGNRPRRFGAEIPGFPTNVPLILSFGGELLSPDLTRSTVASDETIRAYQFLADLIWKDRCAPTPAQGANAAFTFESGKLGMSFNWMGMTPRYREVIRSFEWDVCPVPSGPAGRRSIVKGNQLVVAKNSKHVAEAWRFIRYMTSEETELELHARIRRAFPTRYSVASSPQFLDTDRPPFQTRAFIDSVRIGSPLPINERWAEWTQILNMETDNLMAGRERDAAIVLRRAEARINKALAEEPGF